MPTATRPRRRSRPIIEEEPQLIEQSIPVAESETTPALEPYDPFDEALPFMNAIAAITDEEWQKYWLYLYRLDPKVRNDDDKAFISRYQCAMDEDDIRSQHGGGKFMFWLKENITDATRSKSAGRSRKFKFSIAGDPKLLPGQVLTSPPAAVQAAPAAELRRDDSLAPVLSELVALLKERGGTDDQAMSIMGQAYKTSLTVVSEAAQQTVKSATGSALGDKLLEALLPSLINRPAVEKDPVREALLKSALSRLENPPQAASADGGVGQLAFLKELFGVESIKDLIMPGAGPGDAWKTKLVEVGVSLAANIPMIIQAIMAGQERAFQRELQIASMRERQAAIAAGRLPPDLPSLPAQPVISAAPQNRPPSPVNMPPGGTPVSGNSAAGHEMDPIATTEQALLDIAISFDSGLSGEAAATFVATKYPQFATAFAPLLAEKNQVLMFAKNTEPLKQIADDEDFPEFLEKFCSEILNPSVDETDPATA